MPQLAGLLGRVEALEEQVQKLQMQLQEQMMKYESETQGLQLRMLLIPNMDQPGTGDCDNEEFVTPKRTCRKGTVHGGNVTEIRNSWADLLEKEREGEDVVVETPDTTIPLSRQDDFPPETPLDFFDALSNLFASEVHEGSQFPL